MSLKTGGYSSDVNDGYDPAQVWGVAEQRASRTEWSSEPIVSNTPSPGGIFSYLIAIIGFSVRSTLAYFPQVIDSNDF